MFAVHGIDLSPAMVARLRPKPGADRCRRDDRRLRDHARVDGTFRLVYLVFNTIMNLTTQDDQVACFANAAAHLEPGGCFVIEVGVPGPAPAAARRTFRPFTVTPNQPRLRRVRPRRRKSCSRTTTGSTTASSTVFSAPFRYVWPSELDLMARLAGLTRRERWGGWSRQPFTGDSSSHVSVWQRPPS